MLCANKFLEWLAGFAEPAAFAATLTFGAIVATCIIAYRTYRLQLQGQSRSLKLNIISSCFTTIALDSSDGEDIREKLNVPAGDPTVVCVKFIVSNPALVANSVQRTSVGFDHELTDIPKTTRFWFPESPQDQFSEQWSAITGDPPLWRSGREWSDLDSVQLQPGASLEVMYLFQAVRKVHLEKERTYAMTLTLVDAGNQPFPTKLLLRYAHWFRG